MVQLAQLLALLSLGLSVWRLFPLKPPLDFPPAGSQSAGSTNPAPTELHLILAILLSPLKLLSGALTAIATLAGAVGALLGILSRSPLALLVAGAGAFLSARYLRQLTEPHAGFEAAFGPGWQRRIPSEQAASMLRRRWTPYLPAAPAPRWVCDLPFWTPPDGRRQLLCDLWQPPKVIPPSGLALVFFHGGGWHQFDKDSLTRPFFRHLAAQGHVIMDVAYRLHPETNLAGMVADSKRAIAWLKANALRYAIDPDRIVVAGGSAGGHLALMVAFTPDHHELAPVDLQGIDTSVRAVVAYYPVVDLQAYMAYNNYRTTKIGPLDLTSPQEVVPAVLGGTPGENPVRYRLLSPRSHVGADCPPTLLLAAGHDHAVPVEPIRALHRSLVRAGVSSVYVEYPGAEHAFDLVLPRTSPAAQPVWHDVERFLSLVA
jgi:acetyl esterase/lipase